MSRVLASILMVILLIQGVFQTLELRYCSDKLVAVEINGVKGVCVCNEDTDEIPSLEGDRVVQRTCCDFETVSIASSDFQDISRIESPPQDSDFGTYALLRINEVFPATDPIEAVFYTDTSPPRKRKLASFILNNQFRAFLG